MIELANVTKRYDTKLVLKSLSCVIPTGSTTLVLGSNGSGKSTLMRLIAGIEPLTAGEIHMQQETITYIASTSVMYPMLTAIENLLFWQRLYGYKITHQQCNDILHELNLYHARNRAVRYFSKGMLQRLHLAFLLLQESTLILLDEPCSGLDYDSTQLFYSILQKKQQQGCTILWITHSPTTDLQYAGHVILLNHKAIAFYGVREEYMNYMAHTTV